jgi:hypothetical protein
MPAVPNRMLTLRVAALMAACTFALHELRFLISYGGDSSAALTAQGHGYLVPLTPLVAGVLVLALAGALARAAQGASDRAPGFAPIWAGASASLFTVYFVQESIEGLVFGGHPDGLAGVLGNGGWIALPLAIVLGLAVAFALRGAAEAPALARHRGPLLARITHVDTALLAPDWWPPRLPGAAMHLAPRGPPALSL